MQSTGKVKWSYGGNFATYCKLGMSYYPLDVQKCTIEVENWAYAIDAVDLQNASSTILTESYSQHKEWDLSGTKSEVYSYYIIVPCQLNYLKINL